MKCFLVYKITNQINGKLYIGSTIRPMSQRWSSHKNEASSGRGSIFHSAIRKYGVENFVIEEIFCALSKEDLDIMEQHFIEIFDSHKKNGKGYNAVGVLKGSRQMISDIMKAEWADPETRIRRLKSFRKGSEHRFKPIASVCIKTGAVRFFENVHDAIRAGFSASSIYGCLTAGAKKGMGYCWFYKTEENEQFYYDKAIALLGSFKTNFAAKIKMTSIETGQVTILADIYEAKNHGFLPKEINRVLTGKFKSCRGHFFELAS